MIRGLIIINLIIISPIFSKSTKQYQVNHSFSQTRLLSDKILKHATKSELYSKSIITYCTLFL